METPGGVGIQELGLRVSQQRDRDSLSQGVRKRDGNMDNLAGHMFGSTSSGLHQPPYRLGSTVMYNNGRSLFPFLKGLTVRIQEPKTLLSNVHHRKQQGQGDDLSTSRLTQGSPPSPLGGAVCITQFPEALCSDECGCYPDILMRVLPQSPRASLRQEAVCSLGPLCLFLYGKALQFSSLPCWEGMGMSLGG